MSVYIGTRTRDGCQVTVDGSPLELRLDLYNHSPTGFEWGYGGSGPTQLALAILAHEIGDEQAQECYMDFRCAVVEGLPHAFWRLTSEDIRQALAERTTPES